MKQVIFILTIIIVAGCFSYSIAANDEEAACTTYVSAYVNGLKAGEEQIKKNPSLANQKNNGLSRQEIENLKSTKTNCEIKTLILEALKNKSN